MLITKSVVVHSSVMLTYPGVGGVPPDTTAELAAPEPNRPLLALAKSATSVQDVPSQDSTCAVLGGKSPAEYKPAV